jgi:hypothetical protein
MKKSILLLVLSAVICIVTVGGAGAASHEKAMAGMKSEASTLYVCNCGDSCQCNTVAMVPGKCSCGKELTAMHVLQIDKGEALLCPCGGGCSCTLDAKDPAKCGCGKAVKKVSLKGLYACNCGPACACNTVSDKPGKCGCGSELKKIE